MLLDEILYQYQNLIFKVDSHCEKLIARYREHLVCKPGCSQCCQVERTALPIEAYVIEQHLMTLSSEKIRRLRKLYKDNDETCPMLLKNRCVIYPVRPIICRIVGLPILYREAARAFIDHCRLNFTQLPAGYQFDEEEVLNINPFQIELIEIDQRFAEYVTKDAWRPDNRRSMKNILFHLDLKRKQRSSHIKRNIR